ncbi:hypothetical protein FHG87_002714 [Trinorchestia longiramus]|nr:hypothetical protein FHG87_002714 [Trinorchestia longiramus]
MLSRLYKLKDEVEIFLQKQKQDKLYKAFREEDFQLSLAYLVDFFEAINNLKLKLQGRNTDIIAHSDVIRAFTEKIHLWKRKVQVGNFSLFSHLNELLSEKRNIEQYDVTKEVLSHLHSLASCTIFQMSQWRILFGHWCRVHLTLMWSCYGNHCKRKPSI